MYLFELVPWSRRDVDRLLDAGRDVFDAYTIPEGPGGYPGLFSVATAMYIKLMYGFSVYPHLRLYDINRLALLSIANAIREYGIDGLVLLRGDKPWRGGIVEDIGSEEALELLRKKGYVFRKGLIISLNYPLDKIKERIDLGADFYHVINYGEDREDKLVRVCRMGRERGSDIYVFILLGFGRNIELFRKLNQPFIGVDELRDHMELIMDNCSGIVLSSPFEPMEGIRIFSKHLV